MFERYSDTITVDGHGADETYCARVAGHLRNLPAEPVKIAGGPGTGKVHLLTRAIREAGYRLATVSTATLGVYDTRFVRATADVDEGTGRCILVIDEVESLAGRSPADRQQLTAELRALAEHPNVAATFVVETTRLRG